MTPASHLGQRLPLVAVVLAAAFGGACASDAGPSVATPGAQPVGCRVQSRNPTGPSFGVLFGDNLHRGVSSQFLSGCSPSCGNPKPKHCKRRPFLHVPADAPASELHLMLGEEDPQPYYRDASHGGKDLARPWGIESANVLLFAGHGSPDYIQTKPQRRRLALDDVQLGDGDARYLLMLSCNTMAHGPEDCPGERAGPPAYDCPDSFAAPATECPTNVFAAWLPRLGRKLRLVCGGSTEILAEPAPARFWQNHLMHRLPIADAFLDSLAQGSQVGLCLTRGGADPRATALFDDAFTAKPNPPPRDDAYLYAMYNVADTATVREARSQLRILAGGQPTSVGGVPPDDWLPPILAVSPTAIPLTLRDAAMNVLDTDPAVAPLGFAPISPTLALGAGETPAAMPNLELRIHPRSGALAATWDLPGDGTGDDLIDLASLLALGSALFPDGSPGPGGIAVDRALSAYTLRIDRLPEASLSDVAALRCYTTCTIARLQPSVNVAGATGGGVYPVPIVGEGAEWLLRVCPAATGADGGMPPSCTAAGDGTAALSIVERQMAVLPANDPAYAGTQMVAAALESAWAALEAQLEGPGEASAQFLAPSHEYLYHAAPLHCIQTVMAPLHRFTFSRIAANGEEPHSTFIDVPVYGDDSSADSWDCGGY